MSVQHPTPTCDRCGAPSSRVKGGRLIPLTGFRARHYLHKRGRSTRPHREPPGYVHADPAFCERRGTMFSRTPIPWDLRGRPKRV